MAERLLRVPDKVAAEARHLAGVSDGVEAQRYADIAAGMQVGRSTLLALIASSEGPKLRAWATQQYQRHYEADQEVELRALTAASVDPDGDAMYFGILDPAETEPVVAHVVRASSNGLARWRGAGVWEDVPEDLWPTYLPFRELDGDVLADALVACVEHSGLVLRAGSPRAFLKPDALRRALVASVGQDGVYAALDEADTTAVMSLCRYDQGATYSREDGGWVRDDATLPWLAASGVPLALVPDGELPELLRAFDDHQAVFPLVAAAVSDPSVAGMGVRALDTGRVLMLQRALTDDDPAGGTWEMPGGHLEPGEDPYAGAWREWCEETGCQQPDGSLWGVWHSPDGVYQGHIYNVNSEGDVPIHDGRDQIINPDDPDGDQTEALAWWDPRDLSNPLVRPELANQTNAVHAAMGAAQAQPTLASIIADAVAHTRTPDQLENYWVRGPGAAKIRWGAPHDWSRCVEQLAKYVHNPYVVKGQCNSLHKIATGMWPATHAKLEHGGKAP